jgi:predicted transcriptional regulator
MRKADQTLSSRVCDLGAAVGKIVIALYKNIRMNKSDITEELTLEMISDLAGVNQKSLKNTLFRLTSAGVIIRADQKVGRGGRVKYQLSPDLMNEIQQNDFLALSKIKK